MALDAQHRWIRADNLAPSEAARTTVTGVDGDPTKATPALGNVFLQPKIDERGGANPSVSELAALVALLTHGLAYETVRITAKATAPTTRTPRYAFPAIRTPRGVVSPLTSIFVTSFRATAARSGGPAAKNPTMLSFLTTKSLRVIIAPSVFVTLRRPRCGIPIPVSGTMGFSIHPRHPIWNIITDISRILTLFR